MVTTSGAHFTDAYGSANVYGDLHFLKNSFIDSIYVAIRPYETGWN